MAEFEFADEFLPVYDVSDAVATVANADREAAWRAVLEVDLLKLGREAPMVGVLGALRMLRVRACRQVLAARDRMGPGRERE
jgi:hypothetical protein